MRRDPTEFRKRFAKWKLGKPAYKGGRPVYEDEKESWLDSAKDFVVSAAKFVDPTGILSYGDAYDAWKRTDSNNPASYVNAAVETIGALPFVGKIGKATKLIKSGTTAMRVAKKLRKVTLAVRGVKLAGDTDRMITGGAIEKNVAKRIADKSGGNADVTSVLGFVFDYPYNGYINPSKGYDFEKSGNKNINNVVLLGNTKGYEKYNKSLKYNGKTINNALKDLLFPIDNVRLPKELKPLMSENSGKIIGGNSENWLHDTKINKDILDTKNFSIGITPDTLRAFDVFDWQPNTILGRMMNHAAKPSWTYPSKNTFVQELPVLYTSPGELNDWPILRSALRNVERSKDFLNKADSILSVSGYKY